MTSAGPREPPTLSIDERSGTVTARAFTVSLVEGPASGQTYRSTGARCAIGSHALNELVVDDQTVSRFHCEITLEPGGAVLRDLASRNGTVVDGVAVREAFLRSGSLIRLGNSTAAFELGARQNRLPLSERTRFGVLVGKSIEMRSIFSWLERAAQSDATVLLEGETGTGKGAAARSIHGEGSRAAGPFVTIDCGAIPVNLLESELFGHEKGSFTGAALRRVGAFEEADGGTVFLDEIGELPTDLQPKLLRVLEAREIRRVGASSVLPVNVRVIAATNRDLRAEVNAGRFRSDLYFRLAVVKLALPPLRKRPEDLPALVDSMLVSLKATGDQRALLLRPERLADLARAAWPGNVRELRNHVERSLIFSEELELGDPESDPETEPEPPPESAEPPPRGDGALPYVEARRRALDAFERRYLAELLHLHRGRRTAAAGAAEITRVYLYKLLRKHGLG